MILFLNKNKFANFINLLFILNILEAWKPGKDSIFVCKNSGNSEQSIFLNL